MSIWLASIWLELLSIGWLALAVRAFGSAGSRCWHLVASIGSWLRFGFCEHWLVAHSCMAGPCRFGFAPGQLASVAQHLACASGIGSCVSIWLADRHLARVYLRLRASGSCLWLVLYC